MPPQDLPSPQTGGKLIPPSIAASSKQRAGRKSGPDREISPWWSPTRSYLRRTHDVLNLIVLLAVGCSLNPAAVTSTRPLSTEDLPRTCATLIGYWRETDEFLDDEQQWNGSAVFSAPSIVPLENKGIVLVTNSHCLGLSDLAAANIFTDDIPEIASYALRLRAENKSSSVRFVAETPVSRLDVALLDVPSDAFERGADYLVPPLVDVSKVKVGMRVAAVGSPLEPD